MIELPIAVPSERPFDPPDSPYNMCGTCNYVGTDVQPGVACAKCNARLDDPMTWPDSLIPGHSPIELWRDVVFCWNHKKAELATIAAAFYFEALLFHLLHYGLAWIDKDMNWIGAGFGEYPAKEAEVRRYLQSLRDFRHANRAIKRVFGDDVKTMLRHSNKTPGFDSSR